LRRALLLGLLVPVLPDVVRDAGEEADLEEILDHELGVSVVAAEQLFGEFPVEDEEPDEARPKEPEQLPGGMKTLSEPRPRGRRIPHPSLVEVEGHRERQALLVGEK